MKISDGEVPHHTGTKTVYSVHTSFSWRKIVKILRFKIWKAYGG